MRLKRILGTVALATVALFVCIGVFVLVGGPRPAVVVEGSQWVDLGDVDGMGDHVYRTCDGHVTVYVTIHGPTGVSISTVAPISSGYAQGTPCT